MNSGRIIRGPKTDESGSIVLRLKKPDGEIGLDHKKNEVREIHRRAVELLPSLKADESGPLRVAIVRFTRSYRENGLTEDSWNMANLLASILAETYVKAIKRYGKEVPVGLGGRAIVAEVTAWENEGISQLLGRLDDLDSYHQFLSREALTNRRELLRAEADELARIGIGLQITVESDSKFGRTSVTDSRAMTKMEIALIKNYAIVLSSYLTRTDLEESQREQIEIILKRFERITSEIARNRITPRLLEEIGDLRVQMRELVDSIQVFSNIKSAVREAEEAHQTMMGEIDRYEGEYRRIEDILLSRMEFASTQRDLAMGDLEREQELAASERTLTTEYSSLMRLRDALPEAVFEIETRIEELNRLITDLGGEGSRHQKTDKIALAIMHLEETITSVYVTALQAASMRLRNRTIHSADEFDVLMELDSAAYERIKVYSEKKVNIIDPSFRESLRELYERMNQVN